MIRVAAKGLLFFCSLGCLSLAALAPSASAFERPVPEGGGPTEIRCVMAVLDLDEINDAGQNFTANVIAVFRWNDPREAHGGSGNIMKKLEEVWHPVLLFANQQRAWSNLGETVEISPEGELVYREQFWGDFSQPMNLRDFPFDTQDFTVQVAEAGAEKFGEVVLVQDPKFNSFFAETYSVADWKIVGFRTHSDPYLLPNDEKVNAFSFVFTAERLSTHHLIKVIAPLLLIVMLSWLVFWLDPKEGGSQLGVAVTTFLTVIAYHVALGSRLPEISYLTRLDVFVFSATLLVFLAMVEVVITTAMARNERIKGARWLDRACRLIFPGALVLVVFYAMILR
jgi:hypothetical protein